MKKANARLIALLGCIALIISLSPSLWVQHSFADAEASKEATPKATDVNQHIVLVQDGQPKATIVVASDAGDLEKKAAQQLQSYIQKISGAELLTVTDPAAVQGLKIFVGKAAPDPGTDKILAGGDDPASFRLLVSADHIQLNGLSDQGTLYAAYELLEQLGVRWYMPGEIGTVIPSAKTVAVKVQDTIQHAGFSTRLLQAVDRYPTNATTPKVFDPTEGAPWADHLRLSGPNYGVHGFPCGYTNQNRPDLFLPDATGKPTSQLDVTKPDVLDCVVAGSLGQLQKNPAQKYISMGPPDGTPLVLQPNPEWDGNDYDASHGTLSLTDRYVKFMNLVLDRLKSAGYPDVGIAFYAYSIYERPPVRWEPDPKLLPIFAPITVDRLHAIDNPLSWERNRLVDLISGWQALGVQTGYRGYLFNLAEPGLPFSMINQVASEFKYFKDHNIDFMRVETLPAWAYQGPSLYLAAKMMWNPDLDVQALLDDYFTNFYGPAAKPMREHFDELENAFANGDYFTGNVYDFPHILTNQVMKKLDGSLRKAEALVQNDSVYAKRVQMLRIAFDFGDNFLGMMDSINQFDFVKAKERLDNVNALSMQAISHAPVILSPLAQSYTSRYWSTQVQEGYDRVTGGNEVVAQLPDEWNVMLFPNGSGDQLGLWKPGLGTQSWMKLKTYSETWSDQGLRYYKGDAWYRTTVAVSKNFDQDRPIHLWFSNIDESARVWINGQELPLTKKGRSLGFPWEFDATQAIKFDQPNVIVVDVTNNVLDELGTGGIVGPVMLYQLAQ